MTDRLRIAVAGLGAVAQSVHLPLLARRWDRFDVVAVCDLSASLRSDLGDQYGVAPAQRYAEVVPMVSGAAADGLLLLTSGSHGAAAQAALDQGLAVFCEKPLAYTVAEADQLARAEEAVGRPALLLAYMKTYDDAVARLRDRLSQVDDIRAVETRVLHPTGSSQLAFANLRPAPRDIDRAATEPVRRADEALLDAAVGSRAPGLFRELYAQVVLGSMIHNTSLLRTLFGGLTSVDDVRVWPEDAFPPSVEVSGSVNGGARVRMAWHYLPAYPEYREILAVHHAHGSMQVTFGTPYLLNAPTELTVVESAPGGTVQSVFRSTGEAFENELLAFHEMVTSGAAPSAGIAEGRADIVTSQRIMRRLAEIDGIDIGGEAAAA